MQHNPHPLEPHISPPPPPQPPPHPSLMYDCEMVRLNGPPDLASTMVNRFQCTMSRTTTELHRVVHRPHGCQLVQPLLLSTRPRDFADPLLPRSTPVSPPCTQLNTASYLQLNTASPHSALGGHTGHSVRSADQEKGLQCSVAAVIIALQACNAV